MKPEDAKRIEYIRAKVAKHGNKWWAVAPDDSNFLLRVIEERGKEVEVRDFALNSIIILAGHEEDHPAHEQLSEIQTTAKLARDGANKEAQLKAHFPGLDLKALLGKDPA